MPPFPSQSQVHPVTSSHPHLEGPDTLCSHGSPTPILSDDDVSNVVDAEDHACTPLEAHRSDTQSPPSILSFVGGVIPDTQAPDHPGQGWEFNHPRNRHYYPACIPVDTEHGRHNQTAKYIHYHHHGPYPTVDATMGRGTIGYHRALVALPTGQNIHQENLHFTLLCFILLFLAFSCFSVKAREKYNKSNPPYFSECLGIWLKK